ncbi:MAG: LamG-like jellyroll fold domain-containing protein, partial [Thermoguttaceae bacterium]|nr:LamG-like jellyroll fold domain-containing protein [Thermoguttaceae bacterium]
MVSTKATWRELLFGRTTKGRKCGLDRRGRSLRMEPLEKRELLSVMPVAYWRFDETGGTSAFDASGNNLTGTLIGGAQWTTEGKYDGAIDLDGDGQYVQVSDSDLLDDTSELTISAWVYARTLDGTAQGVVSKRAGADDHHAYSLYFHTGDKLHVHIDGTNDAFAGNTVFQTGRWYHVAVTFDGSLPEAERVKLYVDGVLDTVAAETSTAIPNYASNLTLGTLNSGFATTLDGKVDDVRIYHQALGIDAIQLIMAAPTVQITGVPANPEEGTPITLGSSITDPDPSDIFTYAWTVTKNGAAYSTGTDADLTFTPDDDATYVVSLTVTDSHGGQGTAAETIEVVNVPPTLQIEGQELVERGATYTLTLGDVIDPGTNDLVTQYTIHWGDGQSQTLTASEVAALDRQVTHVYATGLVSRTITVDLNDNDGMHTFVASKDVLVTVPLTWDPDGVTNGTWGGSDSWTKPDAWVDTADNNTRYTWNSELVGGVAIFVGIAGTVTISDPVDVAGITSQTSGHTISNGTVNLAASGCQFAATIGSVTISSVLAGSGGFTKSGNGTLTLTGVNTYSGGTTIGGGTLTLSSQGSLGTGDVEVEAAGTLRFSRSGTTYFDNSVSGAGAITQTSGTLVLRGDNDVYSGAITVSVWGATLQVGDGGTAGTLGAGTVAGTGQLVFDRSDALTVGNAISGG